MSECIHHVPLDECCNACSDHDHPNRQMPEREFTLNKTELIGVIISYEAYHLWSCEELKGFFIIRGGMNDSIEWDKSMLKKLSFDDLANMLEGLRN